MEIIKTTGIKSFIELQKSDSLINLFKAELNLIPVKIKKIQDDFEKENISYKKALEKTRLLNLSKRDFELKIHEADIAIEKYQGMSNSVKDNDSYKAMLAQIGNARKQKDEYETQVLNLMDLIDLSKKEELKAKEKSGKAEVIKDEDIAVLKEREHTVNQFICDETAKRNAVKVQINDADVLSDYETRLVKWENVIFKVEENHNGKYTCPNCNMTLNSATVSNLKRSNLFSVCPDCMRWLYLESTAN